MKTPLVNIIILNWKGWADTIECLESVYKISYPKFNLIVVDNDSQDESIKKIKEWVNKHKEKNKYFKLYEVNKTSDIFLKTNKIPSKNKLFLLQNTKNWGFAEGNNKAIKMLLKNNVGEYVLLLNNDTVVSHDFLDILIKEAEKYTDIGSFGPKIYYYSYKNKKNVIWSGGGLINWWKYPGYFSHHENEIDNKKVDEDAKMCAWVSGACLLIKTSIKLPDKDLLLNNAFFFGCEDVDLAIRLKRKKYGTMYVPKSKIWHKVSRSRPLTIKQVVRSTKTNMKFIRSNNEHFWFFLPLYMFQIPIRYMKLIFIKLIS